MAYAGQVIENLVSGERITFHETAADTGGELLAIDLELSPDGHAPGMHVHPIQEERFEVTEGTMRFKLGGKQMIAHPGDVVVVPPGVRHKFANAGDEEACARVEVRPAPGRVSIFERWESQAAVKAFRRSAPRNKQGAAMLSASVAEYDIADVRHLFGERTP